MPTLKLKSSPTAGKLPTAAMLILGELAVNTADGKLYVKLNDGSIVCVGQSVAGDWSVANLTTTGTFSHKPTAGKVGFFGVTPSGKPSCTGSRGGNAALTNLLQKLAALGLITDNTST